MSDSRHISPDEEKLRAEAEQWTVRRDRGLSAAEAIAFELWLADDSRHRAAMQHSAQTWSLLERIPDGVAQRNLASIARRRRFWRCGSTVGLLAAAAAAVAGLWVYSGNSAHHRGATPPALRAAGPRTVTLADGTLVRLNRGGEVIELFSATERRVVLNSGEAYFTVTKNPSRPFVVVAGTLRIRAVGTAFNVNLLASQIEVLVTEGTVQLAAGTSAQTPTPFVVAGERAVWSKSRGSDSKPASAIVITRVNPSEIDSALAWHDSIIRLGGATLAEIAAEFERRSGHRVILADPELAKLRIGGRFRADDLDGFANLLANSYDLEVDRSANGVLVLRKKPQVQN